MKRKGLYVITICVTVLAISGYCCLNRLMCRHRELGWVTDMLNSEELMDKIEEGTSEIWSRAHTYKASTEQYGKVKRIMSRVRDAEIVHGLVYVATRRLKSEFEKNDSPVPTPTLKQDLYHHTVMVALDRLSSTGTDQSTELLVSLLADSSLSWDGEMAICIGQCITTCGKKAIPYLQQLNNSERSAFARDCIDLIERGRVMRP